MTTAGDLLSQRPHTTLPADDDATDDDDDEPPSPPPQAEPFVGLLDRADNSDLKLPDYQRYWQQLRYGVIQHVTSAWHLHGPNEAGAEVAGSIVSGGQYVGSQLTQLYAARQLGVNFTPFDPGPGITERPGASKLAVYSRPIRERSVGAQLRRLETLANTDLQLSKTRTLFSAFDEDMTVNRAPIRTYRRETTSENPCALCEIAADQVYFTTDLMPIHDNCMCDVEMGDESDFDEHKAKSHHLGFVETLQDTGEQKKAIDALADADAPAEDYHNLIRIEQHGELGPVIRWAGQKFTGPSDLPVPRGIRPVPTISGPGMGHEARLQRNAARVAQQRRQRDNQDMRYAKGHGGISSWLPPTSKAARPIPEIAKPEAKVIPLRPKTKAIDFQQDSLPDIRRAMAAKHSGRVDAFDWEWDDPKYNEETKRQALQAFDEMLDKYPNVHIGRIGISDFDDATTAAETTSMPYGNDVTSIMVSRDWLKRSPDSMRQGWEGDTHGFMFDSARQDPVRQLIWHEFGHAIDQTGGRVAYNNANQIVAKAFTDSGMAKKITEDMSPGVINNAILENQDAMRRFLSLQMSGYSMIDGLLPTFINRATGKLARMGLAPGEAIAQAFSDVELRGDKASEVSKRMHQAVIDSYEHPVEAPKPSPVAAMHTPAVERLREMTEPKPNWTAAQMAKEDNHSTNKAGEVILSDEQRALARQLATDIWIAGAKVEPAISAAAQSSVEHNGGFMSGFAFRQKTGPSLYRKIQAEAIGLANGEPVDEGDLREAALDIKDAVRYTGVFPEEGYWAKGSDLRKALESLGAKVIKDPVGIPLKGYRGRNFAFTLNGTPFEMQVHTELGVATKDEAHKIYNESRVLEAADEAKGIDPKTDPVWVKMQDDMQAKWDTMPIAKGTPVVQTEKDAKSKDPNKILYVAKDTKYRGPSISGGEASLDSPEMVGRARVPSTKYGMDWLPDSPEAKIVAPAREIPDELWNTLPIETLPQGTPLKANEGTLKKKSIDKVVSGKEPFREGYTIKLFKTDDGQLHIVDGHTRVAMYNALGKDMPVRIMDEADLQRLSGVSEHGAMPPKPSQAGFTDPKQPSPLWPELSGAQHNAVLRYVIGTPDDGPGSYNLNQVLRLRPDYVKPDNEYGEEVGLLDGALKASKLPQRTTVRRIVTGQSRDIRAEILSHAKDPSYRLTDPSYMSTSRVAPDAGSLRDWATFYSKASHGGKEPDLSKSVVLQMDLPKGAHALDIASGLERGGGLVRDGHDYVTENEILLPRDTQWRIKSVTTDKESGLPVVKLEPVSPTVQVAPKPRREVIREGAGGAFTPPHDLVAGDLPDGVKWLDQKQMVANIVARYNDCTGSNAWIKDAGMQWYPSANAWVQKLLANTGKDWSMEKATAIVAQFSENASWPANMMRATNYFNGIHKGAFKATFGRTDAIAASDDPMSAMRGPKVNNFGHAILGDDPNAVAIDRWAARIALGTTDKGAADKIKGRVGGYDALKAAYVEAAKQLGLTPRDLQAITWVHAVPPDETVEEFKETGHWNF